MTAAMTDSGDQNAFAANDACDVIRESRNIDTVAATATLALQERLADDGGTDALNFGAKPRAHTRNAQLVMPGRLVCVTPGLWQEFEHRAHQSGAISRNPAKTSAAGIG